MGSRLMIAMSVVLICGFMISPRAQHRQHKNQPSSHQKSGAKSQESGSSEETPVYREGLRCYKCDPTDYNNYCRDFKPNLATPYDCVTVHTETGGKHVKNASPINVSLDGDKPFSCYKIKGDVAYGHGKVYGAKRYGCGHLNKVRSIAVTTLDHECTEVRMGKDKGKDFFEGIICNCDNADGCNSAAKRAPLIAFFSCALLFLRFFAFDWTVR